jgi:hypothetical protein
MKQFEQKFYQFRGDIRAPQPFHCSNLTKRQWLRILILILSDLVALVLAWRMARYLNHFYSPPPPQLVWWTWLGLPSLFWCFAAITLIFFAYGGLIFAYGVSDDLSGYLSPTTVSVSGLNWSTYSSGATIRWATNNAVRIQPTSTSVVPLVVQLQNASWTSGNAFEIQNNGVLKFNVDYAGSTTILSTVGSGSTTTGALVVSGGVGISGSIFGGSTISAADNITIKSEKELIWENGFILSTILIQLNQPLSEIDSNQLF